jgi:hypothetical protein
MYVEDIGGLPSDEDLREHLRHHHGWSALDVITRWDRARTLHRFEHFEDSVGLVDLAHAHPHTPPPRRPAAEPLLAR